MNDLRFRWNGSELVPANGAPILPLYVADSWLVSDGSVVALEKHFARFAASASLQGLVRPVHAFTAAVEAALPRTGTYFPRIDLTERGELEIWIREAPPRFDTIVLATAEADVRTEPALKGPDIVALGQLREQAREVGADDAIILNSFGYIIDGATTCLVWWRDDVLHVPPAEASRVDSVTVSILRELAAEQGLTVFEEWATPAQLAGTTVWALNALHGIRQVTSWVDGPTLGSDQTRLASWRSAYAALSSPLAPA